MTLPILVPLTHRTVIAVTGPDARSFLQNIVTNDMQRIDTGAIAQAALLMPQGKILFEFFICAPRPDGFLIDIDRDFAADFAKRIAMYKLRANVTIDDSEAPKRFAIAQLLNGAAPLLEGTARDPRDEALGLRLLLNSARGAELAALEPGATIDLGQLARAAGPSFALSGEARIGTRNDYDDRRIEAAVPELGADFAANTTFPHEANYDRTHTVDLKKGCFIGQEVVSRMAHKTLVRKRFVRITATGPLHRDSPITAGEASIGTLASVSRDGRAALALLRLDRAIEAREKGQAIETGGHPVEIDPAALSAYATAANAGNN